MRPICILFVFRSVIYSTNCMIPFLRYKKNEFRLYYISYHIRSWQNPYFQLLIFCILAWNYLIANNKQLGLQSFLDIIELPPFNIKSNINTFLTLSIYLSSVSSLHYILLYPFVT